MKASILGLFLTVSGKKNHHVSCSLLILIICNNYFIIIFVFFHLWMSAIQYAWEDSTEYWWWKHCIHRSLQCRTMSKCPQCSSHLVWRWVACSRWRRPNWFYKQQLSFSFVSDALLISVAPSCLASGPVNIDVPHFLQHWYFRKASTAFH